MLLYEFGTHKMTAIQTTTFAAANLKERDDLQRVLRSQIEVIMPKSMVIAEEFSNWTDSKRRIDLLVLDRDANLVVVELKRTEDGGHMELQSGSICADDPRAARAERTKVAVEFRVSAAHLPVAGTRHAPLVTDRKNGPSASDSNQRNQPHNPTRFTKGSDEPFYSPTDLDMRRPAFAPVITH